MDDASAASVLAAIDGRRSIRRGFERRAVADDVVANILRCGCAAPSSKDAQHWRLHAVRDRGVLDATADAMTSSEETEHYVPLDPASGRLREGYESSVAASAEILRHVPLGVFVETDGCFGGLRRTIAQAPRETLEDVLVGYAFELVGIGAAVQSMWLAAHALGLAGVFVGDVVIAERQVRAALGIEGDVIGVLALGYSDAPPWTERRVKVDRAVIRSAADGG